MNPEATPAQAIVIDTNVWVYSGRFLRSALGAALLHAVRSASLEIVVPEVVELEIPRVLKRELAKLVADAWKTNRELASFVGRSLPIVLPDPEEAEAVFRERLQELGGLVRRAPFNLAHARGALLRVVECTPPCDRNQQYKDAAIWECVLESAEARPTHFVTEDKAFFEDRVLAKGLAAALKADPRANNVRIHVGLADCLSMLGITREEPNTAVVESSLGKELIDHIYTLDDERTLVIDRFLTAAISPFMTDDPRRLAYAFTAKFEGRRFIEECADPDECAIAVKGACTATIEKAEIEDLDLEWIRFNDEAPLPFYDAWQPEPLEPTLAKLASLPKRSVRYPLSR